MKFSTTLFILVLALFGAVRVDASCKANEGGFTNDYGNQQNRLTPINPASHVSTSGFATDTITFVSHNVQSGYSLSCNSDIRGNLDEQAKAFKNSHYFTAFEVDINTNHCHCNQPQVYCDDTGTNGEYLRTINLQGGYYGHMAASVYNILETRYYLYSHYTSEVRGILATRTQPPQLKGRDLWVLSTHFQYDSVSTRTATAVELVNYAKQIAQQFPQAFIVCPGDYYVQYGDSDYAELTSYFIDSYYQFSQVHTGGSTYPSDDPVVRYDYVFYRAPADGLTVNPVSFAVFKDTTSDHNPIRVDFSFPSLSSNTAVLPNPYSNEPGTTGSNGGQSITGSGSSSTTGSVPTSAPTPAPTSAPTSTPTSTPTSAPTTPPNGGNGGCTATYKLVPRSGGSYQQDGKTFQIVDIVITNTGKCSITSANIKVPYASGITQVWNYDATTGAVTVYGIMANQQYSGAGFIYDASQTYSGSPSFTYGCLSCAGSQMSARDGFPTETIDTCGINLEITARVGAGSSWTNDNVDYQIYDLTVANNGANPVSEVRIIVTSEGFISQFWNLNPIMENTTMTSANSTFPEEFTVSLFSNSIAPGYSLQKTAGYIVGGGDTLAPANAVFLVSATC